MTQLTAHDFTIEVVSRDEGQLTYRVSGQVTCPTSGYEVTLDEDNEGINPTEEYAVLKLEAAAPEGAATEVITEVPVSEEFTDSADLSHVDVRLYGEIDSATGDTLHLSIEG